MIFRRQATRADDPHFLFMVGRLAGAAEMAALLMMDGTQHVDMVAFGSRLDDLTQWFFTPDMPELPQLTTQETAS